MQENEGPMCRKQSVLRNNEKGSSFFKREEGRRESVEKGMRKIRVNNSCN